MQEILFKIRYFEKGLSKTFKKVNFMDNGETYQKQRGPGTSDQSLFSL